MKIRSSAALLLIAALVVLIGAPVSGAAPGADSLPLERFLQQQHYGTVETEQLHNRQTFEVKINGKDISFELDPGNSFTYVLRTAAWYLGLVSHPIGETDYGMDGREIGMIFSAPISSFSIKGWPINRESEMKVFPKPFERSVTNGVMGFDYLKLNFAIIMAGSSGFLIRPGPMTSSASITPYMRKDGFTPIPLSIFHDRVVAHGTIDGHDFVAKIDPFAGDTIFQQQFADKFKISRGIAGSILPRQMSLGSFQVPPFPIDAGGALKRMFEADLDGIFGRQFLIDHSAVIDAGSSTLWLR